MATHQTIPIKGNMLSIKKILFVALFLSVICILINPLEDRQAEAKKLKLKLKDKKVIKSVVKGLIYKNLSTRKNFLPLPVPIPVRIELSEPPVYLKGKPKYVTIYKPVPVHIPKPLPPIYNVNVYPGSFESVATNAYGNMYTSPVQSVISGTPTSNYLGLSGSGKSLKQAAQTANTDYTSTPVSMINFNDFDDDVSNYYLRKQVSSAANGLALNEALRRDGADVEEQHPVDWLLLNGDEESIDHEDLPEVGHHSRVKRQAYESSYENEPPCYGFPLEINIKSRIKMDQIFPIHGKSQIKKCIKLKPLLPPVENYPPSY